MLVFITWSWHEIGFERGLLKSDWTHQSPCHTIQKIQFLGKEWILQLHYGRQEQYAQVSILIDNILFQLIQFTNANQKKLIVLFYDQVPKNQLRLLYLKAINN